MTRLLLFLAAYFAGSLATNHGEYGAGDVTAGSAGTDGQAGSGSAGVSINAKIEISIKIIAKGQGGPAPRQILGEPAVPPGKTHQVTVGGSAGLVFTPDNLAAEPGDMVQFHFLSKNHTITQSAFAKPCVKLADGADSGFMPNADETLNPPPTYLFQVLDKKPIWFYCRQKSHCGSGMTFSINPTVEKSQAKFRQLAIDQNGTADGAVGGYASPPGGYLPSVVPPPAAATGVVAPSGTAPAASGAFPTHSANSTVYSAPLQPPSQESNAAGSTTIIPPQENNIAVSTGVVPPIPGATQQANLVNGIGDAASGQCQCSCLCGVAPFPVGAGIGMWGGMSGSVPS